MLAIKKPITLDRSQQFRKEDDLLLKGLENFYLLFNREEYLLMILSNYIKKLLTKTTLHEKASLLEMTDLEKQKEKYKWLMFIKRIASTI